MEIEFEGSEFIFAGNPTSYTRDFMSAMVKEMGGAVKRSTSGHAAYLVAGKHCGLAVLQRAITHNAIIISDIRLCREIDTFITNRKMRKAQ